jgi:hypothetical protein
MAKSRANDATIAQAKRNLKRAVAELAEHNKKFRGDDIVKVGLPRDAVPYPDGTSVVMVGAVHEFGSPVRNIPQRSYLRATLIQERGEFKKLMKKLLASVSKGKRNKREALGLLGTYAVAAVKQTITDGGTNWPPLKSPRKRGSLAAAKPLMDTGHLRASITYTIGEN